MASQPARGATNPGWDSPRATCTPLPRSLGTGKQASFSSHTQSAVLSDPASPRDKVIRVFKTPVQRPEEPLSGSEKAGFQSWGTRSATRAMQSGCILLLGAPLWAWRVSLQPGTWGLSP